MLAAVLEEIGHPPSVREFDEPAAGAGASVVEVEAAGVNPIDLASAAGALGAPILPSVVGREGIGRTGDGRRVYFDTTVPPYGSFAERCLVADEQMVVVPEGVDAVAAMPFGIAGMAAWLGLGWRGQLREGETVLVLGATSVVGRIGVQVARHLGAGRVVAAARDADELGRVSALGADGSVVLDGAPVDELSERMREACGGGADLVLDMLWGDPALAALGALRRHGRLVQVGNSASPAIELGARPLRVEGISILGHINFNAPVAVKADAFAKLCALDGLEVPVEEVALADAGAAWERQAGGPHAKLVIRP